MNSRRTHVANALRCGGNLSLGKLRFRDKPELRDGQPSLGDGVVHAAFNRTAALVEPPVVASSCARDMGG